MFAFLKANFKFCATKKTKSASSSIKDKKGKPLTKNEDIKENLVEHVEDLYNDSSSDYIEKGNNYQVSKNKRMTLLKLSNVYLKKQPESIKLQQNHYHA